MDVYLCYVFLVVKQVQVGWWSNVLGSPVEAIHKALATTFLPVGYPKVSSKAGGGDKAERTDHLWYVMVFLGQSVRGEYLNYQVWDTVQALCSYLRGILTTKSILEGTGVGSGDRFLT